MTSPQNLSIVSGNTLSFEVHLPALDGTTINSLS